MSTTLPYNRKKPEDGDDSAQWFEELGDNIVLDDSHNHDGDNSALLDAQSIAKADVVIKEVADWSTGSVGNWSLVVLNDDIPAGFKSAAKDSSELTNLVIMDSDSDDERVYLRYAWSGRGNTASITLYSNTKLNLKILFV